MRESTTYDISAREELKHQLIVDLHGPEAALAHFDVLDPLYEPAGIPQMRSFGTAYKLATLNAVEGLANNAFQLPHEVATNVPNFFNLMREEVYTYLADGPVSKCWATFLGPKYVDAHEALQILGGMGGHVRVHLPISLYRSGSTPAYYPDYTLVINRMLKVAADECMDRYVETVPLLRNPMLDFVTWHVGRERDYAWGRGMELLSTKSMPSSEAQLTYNTIVQHLDRRAEIRGKQTLAIGSACLRASNSVITLRDKVSNSAA